MDEVFSTILIAVVILVVVFLILREIMCWYWKINEGISLLKEQNSILIRILKELRSDPDFLNESKPQTSDVDKPQTRTGEDNSNQGDSGSFQPEFDIDLTPDEQSQAEAFVKFGFKPGQCLAINKTTRQIDRFDEHEWNKMDHNDWIILIQN